MKKTNRLLRRLLGSTSGEAGFTLLEVMIAIAIMLVAFASILMVESGSINTAARARKMNVVSMLAKNVMVEAERDMRGKPFNELKEETSGEFKEEAFQDFRWKRVIKEVKLPSLNMGGGGDQEGGGDTGGQTREAEIMTRLLTNYLSKAVREVTVTVSWKQGPGEQSFILSTYWVDLGADFAITE